MLGFPDSGQAGADSGNDELLAFKDEATLLEELGAKAAAPQKPSAPVPEPEPERDPFAADAADRFAAEPMPTPKLVAAPAPRALAPVTPAAEAEDSDRPTVLPAGAHTHRQPNRVTLGDLRALDVPRSWQEIVAVVLEFLDAPVEDGIFPDPDAAVMLANGRIHPDETVRVVGQPVTRVAVFARDLLPKSHVPHELIGLVDRDSGPRPEHVTVQEFMQALSYFERPNRRNDVASLYARAKELLQRQEMDQELERLRAKVAAEVDSTASHEAHWLQQIRGLKAQRLTVALWSLILLNAVVLVWLIFAPEDQTRLSPITPRRFQAVGSLPGAPVSERPAPTAAPAPGVAQARTETNASAAISPRVTPPIPISTPGVSLSAPTPTNMVMTRPPVTPTPPAEWSASIREVMPPWSPAPNVSPTGTTGTRISPNTVFTQADLDVTPAVLQFPQATVDAIGLIANGGSILHLSEFEVVVDQKGAVERVRLLSQGNQLRDKMLLAAAKAWRFSPALREGRPVKYRLRLSVPQ